MGAGLSNLLVDYPEASGAMTKEHYMKLLTQYAVAHTQSRCVNYVDPTIQYLIDNYTDIMLPTPIDYLITLTLPYRWCRKSHIATRARCVAFAAAGCVLGSAVPPMQACRT